jgi:hypothetical protein
LIKNNKNHDSLFQNQSSKVIPKTLIGKLVNKEPASKIVESFGSKSGIGQEIIIIKQHVFPKNGIEHQGQIRSVMQPTIRIVVLDFLDCLLY